MVWAKYCLLKYLDPLGTEASLGGFKGAHGLGVGLWGIHSSAKNMMVELQPSCSR